MIDQRNPGAYFEIAVEGKPRSFRDDKAIATEAALYLKQKHPTQAVTVQDMRDNTVLTIGWKDEKAFVQTLATAELDTKTTGSI